MPLYRLIPERDRSKGWNLLSLFGIPVFVEPSFLLLIVLFFAANLDASDGSSPIQLGLWCFIMIGSLLAHELGHALSARLCGCDRIRIGLWIGGGLAYHSPTTTGRSLVIIAAGPAAGFGLGAAAWLLAHYTSILSVGPPEAMLFVIKNLILINLFWNCFNLIPMHPLDGGQGLFHILTLFLDHNTAMLFVSRLSMVLAVACGMVAVRLDLLFLAFMCISFFMTNFQIARVLGRS